MTHELPLAQFQDALQEKRQAWKEAYQIMGSSLHPDNNRITMTIYTAVPLPEGVQEQVMTEIAALGAQCTPPLPKEALVFDFTLQGKITAL